MIEVVTAAETQNLTTVGAVKLELNIAGGADDEFLAKAVRQASATAAAWCGRTFGLETVRESVRNLGRRHGRLVLSRHPVAAIVSVRENDNAALLAGDYELDVGGFLYRLDNAGSPSWWPYAGRVTIEYRAGYVLPGQPERTLPEDVERAAILLVKSAYFGRTRDPAIRSEDVTGLTSTTYAGLSNGATLPPEVEGLLAPYRERTIC